MQVMTMIVVGPIRDPAADEIRFRHDDIEVAVGSDSRVAQFDIADVPALARLQFDEVTDFQDAFQQNDDTGYKIGDNVFQAKTNADKDGATEQRHTRRTEADAVQAD